jgi:predicted nucleic acid-binding protein
VEATAGLARMRKGERLTPAQLRSKLVELERLWPGLYVHAVSEALLAQAAENARAHSLRAYDAVHLAGALAFSAAETVEFACWDEELRDAAAKHGLALLPRDL